MRALVLVLIDVPCKELARLTSNTVEYIEESHKIMIHMHNNYHNNQPVARSIRYRKGTASVMLHTRLVLEPTATAEKTTFLLLNWQRYVSLSGRMGRLWDTVTPTYVANKRSAMRKSFMACKLLQFEDHQ